MTLNFFTDADGYLLGDGPVKSKRGRFCRPKPKKQNSDYAMTPAKRSSAKLQHLRKRAADKGLEFDLDEAWLASKLALTHCEVTGIEFQGAGVKSPWALSIDRTDNSKGYTKENCKVVVWLYNNCKNKYSEADIMKLARALVCD